MSILSGWFATSVVKTPMACLMAYANCIKHVSDIVKLFEDGTNVIQSHIYYTFALLLKEKNVQILKINVLLAWFNTNKTFEKHDKKYKCHYFPTNLDSTKL